MVNYSRQIEIQRRRVTRDFLPDRCMIIPRVGTEVSVSASGILQTNTPVARQWEHPFPDEFEVPPAPTSSIPCRFDPSRSMQPDRLKVETTVVGQYVLELPFNMEILENDRVLIGDEKYEVMKLDKHGEMSVTKTAYITTISTGYDHD